MRPYSPVSVVESPATAASRVMLSRMRRPTGTLNGAAASCTRPMASRSPSSPFPSVGSASSSAKGSLAASSTEMPAGRAPRGNADTQAARGLTSEEHHAALHHGDAAQPRQPGRDVQAEIECREGLQGLRRAVDYMLLVH